VTLYISKLVLWSLENGVAFRVMEDILKDIDFYLNYKMYSADCEKFKDNFDEPLHPLTKTVNKKLTNKDILLIKQYAYELVDAKFKQPSMMHAGYIFELKTSNEELNIYVYT
jgi:hypothetical protein